MKYIDLALGRLSKGEDWSSKSFADIANYFRNELKHYIQGEGIVIAPESACDLIGRVAENLWLLSGRDTEQVRRYLEWRHST